MAPVDLMMEQEDPESDVSIPLEEDSDSSSDASCMWEWSFVKSPVVDALPKSKEYTLLQCQWWKAASRGQPLRVNATGKPSSSAAYHQVMDQRVQRGQRVQIYQQSAANPRQKFRPIVLRAASQTLVVVWKWTLNEDASAVVVEFTYAASTNNLWTMVFDTKERMTTGQMLGKLHSELVQNNVISQFTVVRNGYGLPSQKLVPWCRGKGASRAA